MLVAWPSLWVVTADPPLLEAEDLVNALDVAPGDGECKSVETALSHVNEAFLLYPFFGIGKKYM